MPKTTKKTVKEPIITIRIVPGIPTQAQKTASKRFWSKLIAQVQEEVKNG